MTYKLLRERVKSREKGRDRRVAMSKELRERAAANKRERE
jgi:hypothetical protein